MNGAMDTDPLQSLRGLWAYSPAIDSTESSCIHLRNLTDDECAQVARALVLFTELTVGAPYIELQRTHEELVDALDRFTDAPDQYTAYELATEVRRRFRHWLVDVKTFTDRLRPIVSRLFGRSHNLFTLVVELKTAEGRSNFAYELVVEALRDESTHSHEVLNALRYNGFTDQSGAPRHLNTAKIDPVALGRTISKREAKATLAKARGLIDVRLLAARTMDSCLAIHAEMIRSIQKELDPMLATVLSLHSEVTATGAGWSLIADLGEATGSGSRDFRALQNPWQQARDLSAQLVEWSDDFVGPLHVQMTAEQLVSQSTEIGYLKLISVGQYDQVPPDFLQRKLDESIGE